VGIKFFLLACFFGKAGFFELRKMFLGIFDSKDESLNQFE
jgi:hypothetical protein